MGQVAGSMVFGTPFYTEQGVGSQSLACVWERFPLMATLTDPHTYVMSKNDFTDLVIASNTFGGFTFTSVTSGSIVQDTTNPSGILNISAGAVTANQGVNWQLNVSPFKVAASKPVAFECVFNISGLSTTPKFQVFVGLAAVLTAVITSGAMAAVDRIGFQGITTTGVLNSVARGGGTAVVNSAADVTIATGVTHRLGFYATATQIDFYVDGIITNSITSQIPTGVLTPTFVVQGNGTVTAVMNLDSYICAGYRQ